MIEDEILSEIKEDQADRMEEPYLSSQEPIHWSPVSNIPVEEIYKDLPEVKRYHDDYCRVWLKDKSR